MDVGAFEKTLTNYNGTVAYYGFALGNIAT
jgi:hypothetical protein